MAYYITKIGKILGSLFISQFNLIFDPISHEENKEYMNELKDLMIFQCSIDISDMKDCELIILPDPESFTKEELMMNYVLQFSLSSVHGILFH